MNLFAKTKTMRKRRKRNKRKIGRKNRLMNEKRD